MKFLFVSNLFPPHHIGGYEIACKDAASALRDSGHECYILTSDYTSASGLDYPLGCDNLVYRELWLHCNWNTPYDSKSFVHVQLHNETVLSKFLEAIKPDYVYFWNIFGLGWSIASCAQEHSGVTSIYHFMDVSILIYHSRFPLLKSQASRSGIVYSNIFKYINNAIFISFFLERKLRVPACKSAIIYPFIDQNLIRRKTCYTASTPIKGVYLGQISKHKGIYFLCETLFRMRLKYGIDLILDVFGLIPSSVSSEILERYSDFVFFRQNVPRYKILSILHSYDIGFFPSIWKEPFGIAQIEMMMAGLPVISSGQGGSREVLEGNNIVFYNNLSQSSLINATLDIINNYSTISAEMGNAAFMHSVATYSPSNYLKCFNQFLAII